jgi:hypothetical protein
LEKAGLLVCFTLVWKRLARSFAWLCAAMLPANAETQELNNHVIILGLCLVVQTAARLLLSA